MWAHHLFGSPDFPHHFQRAPSKPCFPRELFPLYLRCQPLRQRKPCSQFRLRRDSRPPQSQPLFYFHPQCRAVFPLKQQYLPYCRGVFPPSPQAVPPLWQIRVEFQRQPMHLPALQPWVHLFHRPQALSVRKLFQSLIPLFHLSHRPQALSVRKLFQSLIPLFHLFHLSHRPQVLPLPPDIFPTDQTATLRPAFHQLFHLGFHPVVHPKLLSVQYPHPMVL